MFFVQLVLCRGAETYPKSLGFSPDSGGRYSHEALQKQGIMSNGEITPLEEAEVEFEFAAKTVAPATYGERTERHNVRAQAHNSPCPHIAQQMQAGQTFFGARAMRMVVDSIKTTSCKKADSTK